MNDERVVVGRHMGPIAEILDAAIEGHGGRVAIAQQASRERIAELRDEHVRRYERRLASGNPAVNVLETQYLLGLWQRMEGKSFSELGETEQLEVLDALVTG